MKFEKVLEILNEALAVKDWEIKNMREKNRSLREENSKLKDELDFYKPKCEEN